MSEWVSRCRVYSEFMTSDSVCTLNYHHCGCGHSVLYVEAAHLSGMFYSSLTI